MKTTTLRAYLCTAGTCGMFGMDLAQLAAGSERPILILPASWLLEPRKAPEGFRRLLRDDRRAIKDTGEIRFPIVVSGDPEEGFVVVRDENWLAFKAKQ